MKLFTRSKRFAFILAVVIVASSLGAMAALACGKSDEAQEAAGKIEESGDAKGEEYYVDFYQLSYDRATPEQRKQLEAIFADDSLGSMGEWRRDVLITLGDLPADTPRLTAQDAANLYGRVPFDQMDDEFNKIAGAPDWEGGSGIHRSIYYLNDERTEAIYLMLGDVSYRVTNEDGTRTRLPVGTQVLPPNPGPSVAPDPNATLPPTPRYVPTPVPQPPSTGVGPPPWPSP